MNGWHTRRKRMIYLCAKQIRKRSVVAKMSEGSKPAKEHERRNEDLYPTRKARNPRIYSDFRVWSSTTVQDMENRRFIPSGRGCANLSISRIVGELACKESISPNLLAIRLLPPPEEGGREVRWCHRTSIGWSRRYASTSAQTGHDENHVLPWPTDEHWTRVPNDMIKDTGRTKRMERNREPISTQIFN